MTSASSSPSSSRLKPKPSSALLGLPSPISAKPSLRRKELKGLQLFTAAGFLSDQECESFIRAAEALEFKHQGSLGPSKGEAFRDNDRISVHSPALAKQLWETGISSLFKDVEVDGRHAVGLNPSIRFYRYKRGQKFGQHIDESVKIDEAGELVTCYTLLVYLNSSASSKKDAKGAKNTRSSSSSSSNSRLDERDSQLEGGETVFYSSRNRVVAEVAPVSGMALLHLHGDDCMLHEARVVKKGAKYVLRSDVVFQLQQ